MLAARLPTALKFKSPNSFTETPGGEVYHTEVPELLDAGSLVEIAGPGWLAAFANARAAPEQLGPAALAGRVQAWVAARLQRSVPVLYADQRHTAIVYSYGAHRQLPAKPHCVGICDGLLTAERNVALTVRTADCLPVMIAGGGVVAMLHGGWRSLAADILGKCVRRCATEYGVGAETLQAVIGVGIGPCHYPVGSDVAAALASLPVTASGWQRDGRVDLAAWAKGRLINSGIRAAEIRTLAGCTACSPDHHSFRRDGQRAGRQWAAVLLI